MRIAKILPDSIEVEDNGELVLRFSHPSGEPTFGQSDAPKTIVELLATLAPDATVDLRNPVPESVTPRQARLALLGAGLLANVEAGLAAIPDPAQRQAAQIEWEYATTVVRDSSWVQSLGSVLGLTAADIDALFEAASRI